MPIPTVNFLVDSGICGPKLSNSGAFVFDLSEDINNHRKAA